MKQSWIDTAQAIVSNAITNGLILESDHQTIIAALALYRKIDGVGHPSYCNTAFAIAAALPESIIDTFEMKRLAFNLLTNGLSGYFQFDTHNGGTFSVWDALVRQNVVGQDEDKESFGCTHPGCEYYFVKNELLPRICTKWNLPLLNPELGGKPERTISEVRLLEQLINRYPGTCASETENIQRALNRLSTGR
jgi:hypothetical protein